MQNQKNILITGCSSGFGAGAAKALAQGGHRVFATMRAIHGKNERSAADLRAWAKEHGHALSVLELDVTDDAGIESTVRSVVDEAGAIDVLINNAGIGTWGYQEGFLPEQVQRLFDVNIVGVLRMNRAVLPHMRQAGQGLVMYVSSGLGRIKLPFLGPYSATKHALEAIAGCGHLELRTQGIDSCIVAPGAMGTSFLTNSIQPGDTDRLDDAPALKGFYEGFAGAFEERAKTGQLGDPQDVVDAIVELVDAEPATRPFKVVVGEDVKANVDEIDGAIDTVHDRIYAAFGLD